MLILWHLCVMQFGLADPRLCRRRYEIVPRTEKMSACQTLKACNLLGMFLLVCVTVVREPHAQAASHATSFSPSLCRSLDLSISYTPLHPFTIHYFSLHTHTHTPCLFLKMVSAQWLLHWGLNVLSYIGWSLPSGQKAI